MRGVTYEFESLPLDEDDDVLVEDISAQLGIGDDDTDYRVPVYQHGPKGLAWLFDYTLSDETPLLERLRDDYGGGLFEVRTYRAGKIAKRQKVNVGVPKHKPQPKPEGLSGSDIVGMMREMQAQNLAQVKDLIGHVRAQQQPVDPLAMRREFYAEIAQLKEIFSQPAPEPRRNAIKELLEYEDARQQLGLGQDGGEKSLVQEFMPLLAPLLAAAQQPQQRLPPPGKPASKPAPNDRSAPPAYQPQPPTGSNGEPAKPEPPPEEPMNELQKGLSQLCMAATLKLDPENTAANLANNASDEHYWMLAELVDQADCVDRLVAVYAPVEPHRAWFEALRAALQAIFAAETEDEDADADDEPDERSAAEHEQPDSAGTMPARSAAQNDAEVADAAGKPAGAASNARETPER